MATSMKVQQHPSAPPVSKLKRAMTLAVSQSMPSLGNANGAPTESTTDSKDKFSKRMMSQAFAKPIVGDIFGSSDTMLGMLYRSRVQESLHLNKEGSGSADAEAKTGEKDKQELGSSLASVDMFDRESDSEDEQMERMNPRQQLATTIKNWSSQAENDAYIISEGAVHALIALAAMDDNHTKKCCATALYHLSSRAHNREALLGLGAAGGIITISMQAKSWRIAKTCAQTLANLSMHTGGETSMAKDGAILASVILLGLKGNRLLPISMQALYNLTCSTDYYKGMERIVKAFLSLPALSPAVVQAYPIFDTSLLFLKALRNSARFSWIRARLVEDGVVSAIGLIAAGLGSRTHKLKEVVTLVADIIRLLSDSAVVRTDLIQKGALEILQQCLPHCTDDSRLQLVKTVFNLSGSLASMAAFEQAAQVVAATAQFTYHPTVLQYASACISLLAADGCMRGRPALIEMMVELLPGLLQNREPLAQYYCVHAAGCLLFGQSSPQQEQEGRPQFQTQGKEALIVALVRAGEYVSDPDAITGFTTAIARVSQDASCMAVLSKHVLLETVLDLLLRIVGEHQDVAVVQETCCVALTRISLLLGESSLTTPRRAAIADVLFSQLEHQDLAILSNTLGAIRALGEKNLCNEDLLRKPTLTRIATIIAKFAYDVDLCRMSCAVLAAFSYDVSAHAALTEPAVLDVVFAATKSEDGVTREMVATTICNMSVDEHACRKMINKGVVEVLATLSGATSEIIQELCAKCFCNLTCTVDMHAIMIQNKVLQTILMIALVRSVASKTKQLCACALLNLVSEDNIAALKEAGATRVFAAISSSPQAAVQHICAQGFLLFSATATRRDDLVTRRPVLQSLFNMVRCSSARSRILVGMTICNLLACPSSQKSAIHGGALSVFKLIATQDFEELKEASARTIISLGQSPGVLCSLPQHPLVPLLVMILHSSRSFTFDCALSALACLAHTQMFRAHMISEGAVVGLVEAVLAGRIVSVQAATETVRCLYFLSYVQDKMEYMTVKCHVLLALHVLYKSALLTVESAQMVALIIRNASENKAAVPYLVSEGAFLLQRGLLHCLSHRSTAIARSVVVTVLNLSKNQSLHESVIEQGCINMLRCVVLGEEDKNLPEALVSSSLLELGLAVSEVPFQLTHLDSLRVCAAIRKISTSPMCREMMAFLKVVDLFRSFHDAHILDEDSRGELAGAMQNIASSRACVAMLVQQQAAELLLSISKEAHSMETKSACSTALGQISESTKVKEGTVASLLVLTLEKEDQSEESGGEVASALRNGIRASASVDNSLINTAGGGKAKAAGGGSVKSLRQMIRDGIASGRVNKALQTMPDAEPTPAPPAEPDPAPTEHAPFKGLGTKREIDSISSGTLIATEHGLHKTLPEDAATAGDGGTKKGIKGMLAGHKLKDAVKKLTAFDMSSVESILRELEAFSRSYDDLAYHTFTLEVHLESGGVVGKKAADSSLALPTLHSEGASVQQGGKDRSGELTKLVLSMEPQPKDVRIITKFHSPVALSKEFEGREGRELGQPGPQVDDFPEVEPVPLQKRSSSSRSDNNASASSRRKSSLVAQRDMLESLSLLKPTVSQRDEAKEKETREKELRDAGARKAESPADVTNGSTSVKVKPPPGANAAWSGMNVGGGNVGPAVRRENSSTRSGSPKMMGLGK